MADPSSRPPVDDDKLHEECGVFGVFGHRDAAALTALGLHALQHRGQEAAGIISSDGRQFVSERRSGLVGDNFSKASVIDRLSGSRAIGHVRYSTAGGSLGRNIQPLFAEFSGGGFAVAHNGNLTNAGLLQRRLQSLGSIFQSTSDTEVILHLIATTAADRLLDRVVGALKQVEGAYSLVCPDQQEIDRLPRSTRGQTAGARSYRRSVDPGVGDLRPRHYRRHPCPRRRAGRDDRRHHRGTHKSPAVRAGAAALLHFEYVYFARPDSNVEGRTVYEVRKRIGAELAREAPANADLVVPVPDSGVPAAIGFSQSSVLPFELGIIRNHYVGRTFIEPSDSIRHMGVKLKHNANRDILQGKRVVLVDDSIVRGTTSSKIVQMVRDAGAKEVHLRIASPPTRDSCFYGVDTPEKSKLIGSHMSVDKMREFIKADSLEFLSIDGLYRAVGEAGREAGQPQFCDACFTGDYPTALTDQDQREGSRSSPLLAETA